MATRISKKRKFVADGVLYAEVSLWGVLWLLWPSWARQDPLRPRKGGRVSLAPAPNPAPPPSLPYPWLPAGE